VSGKLNVWAKEQLKIDANSVFLLSNIVRAISHNNSVRKEYEWVIVSNIKPIKNQMFAVELAKCMNKTLLIIGNIHDQQYYEQLKHATKGYGQQIYIRTDIQDVRPYLRQAKLGLHVSKSETGPLALIEYLSVGLPFVSFHTGEVSETVNVDFPEFILSSFDIETWINAIKKIAEKDTNKYATQLLHFYESNFGETQYVKTCLKIYQNILDVS
jgi:glycosyltransferase involved in cell wall biosynthesis